jgi:serine-type D-Ala-D-Ala carboxypeptidase/endopeptidase (penicillin-binding protein 4)
MHNKTRLCFFIFLICPLLSLSQNSIHSFLLKIDSSAAFKTASWGFCLLNGHTGRTIAQFNASKSLIPASTQKLFTTATATALLGDTFRFKTEIWAKGTVSSDGTLQGDLIIKGKGNPLLGSEKGSNENPQKVVSTFAAAIANSGIKHVNGSLMADLSYFTEEPIPNFWPWYDIGNYYAPSVSTLNIGENKYELYFKPGTNEGDSSTFLYTKPKINYLQIVNHTTTALGGGDQTYLPGAPNDLVKHIYGKMPKGDLFKVKGALPLPERFFIESLAENGLPTNNTLLSRNKNLLNHKTDNKLFTHHSPSLKEICKYANHLSHNLSAECLLRTLGAEKGKEGSIVEGLRVTNEYLATKIKDTKSLRLTDGSGLSKYNLCSPTQMAQFLYAIQSEKWFNSFLYTIPTSGKNGTLENFCDNTKAEGKVTAKSGSMERTKCYAGYIKSKNGQLNPFAIFVNNHDVPNREIVAWIERLMERCIE